MKTAEEVAKEIHKYYVEYEDKFAGMDIAYISRLIAAFVDQMFENARCGCEVNHEMHYEEESDLGEHLIDCGMCDKARNAALEEAAELFEGNHPLFNVGQEISFREISKRIRELKSNDQKK